MKIACLVTNDLSQDRRMDRICSALSGAGHDVYLIGRERPDSLPLTEKPYQQIRLPIKRQSGKGFYLEYNYRLYQYLIRQPWDAINAVDLDTILPAYLAARRQGAKLVYDAHEFFSETPEVVNRPLIKKTWEALGRWLVPKANLCYTVGPELARILGLTYGVNFGLVRNVPLRLQADQRTAVTKTNPRIILYQGMLNLGRGLEAAIGAIRQLPEEYVLWLVGSGDLERQLREANADLVASGRLVFHGFIPGDQLAAYTARAWLGLNLLDAVSPSYYYSLANKCFDYIQSGLPSIQMDFPEYSTLQREYHCFVLADRLDATRLAIQIAHLGQHPQVYEQLVAGCQRAAKKLNWDREKNELLRLWRGLEQE